MMRRAFLLQKRAPNEFYAASLLWLHSDKWPPTEKCASRAAADAGASGICIAFPRAAEAFGL